MDALVTSEESAEPKLISVGDPQKSAPKGKCVGNCSDEETETSQNVPIDVGPLRYCQTMVMRWRLTNPHKRCHHCHLIPGSRGQRRFAGCF